MFTIDAAMGDVVRTTREPMVGQIRLAWWRERLLEIDQAKVPAEPHLAAAARLAADYSTSGAMLTELVDRWEPMLTDFPWESEVIGPIAGRGAILFGYAAFILSVDEPGVKLAMSAGSVWALIDVARHCSDADSCDTLIDVAKDGIEKLTGTAVGPAVRPLTMLGRLARRDLERWPRIEPEATPARAWVMIHHRLTGKL